MTFLASANLGARELTALFLSLAVLLGLARLMGELARRFGQPSVLGEILAGILLGPTVLQYIAPDAYVWLFPTNPHDATRIAQDSLFQLSVAFLLLVAGLEVDLSSVWRQGKTMLMVSGAGIVVPAAAGFALGWFLPRAVGGAVDPGMALPFALFIGIALSITALPVIAKILMDLNMLKSDMGMLVMSGAMINDLVGWLGFAAVLALIGRQDGSVLATLLFTALFVVGMMTVGRWAADKALPYIQAHMSYPTGVIGFVLIASLACAAITEAIGIHSIFGAFIAGVVIGDSRHLRQRSRDTIHQFITSIFAPIFFASIGLRVNFVTSFDLLVVLVILLVATTGKIAGCYLGATGAGLNRRESLAVGFGMAAQGTMGIILGQLALNQGLINKTTFVAIVIMAIVTSMISGPAMQRILRRKQRRTLGDLLSDKQFVAAMTAADVPAALTELSQRAAAVTGLPAGDIYQAVWQREQIMPTGLGNHLAVPHARMDKIDRPTVIVGRSSEGVDFDAADGQPARIICLLLSPEHDPTAQLDLLDTVARAFASAEARGAALAARNFTEFLAALRLHAPTEGEHDM